MFGGVGPGSWRGGRVLGFRGWFGVGDIGCGDHPGFGLDSYVGLVTLPFVGPGLATVLRRGSTVDMVRRPLDDLPHQMSWSLRAKVNGW